MNAKKLKQKQITFRDLVRENTGCHSMDSGGANGRQWQRPLPSDDITWDVSQYTPYGKTEPVDQFSVTIPLHLFLEQTLEIDHDLTMQLRQLQKENDTYNYADSAAMFAEHLGLIDYEISDNSYNTENDLSQNFQYSIIGEHKHKDYYYNPVDNNEVLILLQTHNGADIRGGYSSHVVCKLKSSAFWDLTCDIGLDHAWDANGVIYLNADGGGSIGDIRTDRWESGYSSCPTNTFGEDVKKVISVSEDNTKLTVELKNGFFATVYAGHRSEYC